MGNDRMEQFFWCWRQMPVPGHLQWLMAEMSHFTAPSHRCRQDKAGLDWQLPPLLSCPTGHSRTHLYTEARHLLLKAKLFVSFQQQYFFLFFAYMPQDSREGGKKKSSRDYYFPLHTTNLAKTKAMHGSWWSGRARGNSITSSCSFFFYFIFFLTTAAYSGTLKEG